MCKNREKLELWQTRAYFIVVGEYEPLAASQTTILMWCTRQGVEEEVHVLVDDALILKLVLEVPPHIEDQLKVVVQETMWIEQRLFNFPNRILMRSYVCIKRCW
jgi:hypothetical protein